MACVLDLALDRPTNKYAIRNETHIFNVVDPSRFVEYAMHRVRMLQHFGVTPFLVFDGDKLPIKAGTENDRARKREESMRIGLELLRAGKQAQAYLELQKAIEVTPEMASQLIEELRRIGVKFIVAPYEADAQLAYLERKGIISGIISEDADLLIFGAKCLLTKLDQYGDCVEINRAHFTACKEVSLVGWSDAEFRRMAILSGCDYLPNINKIGLKTAYRLVRKYKTVDRIIRAVPSSGRFTVPIEYLADFRRAELTFLHQRVFCPVVNRLVMHTDPDEDIEEGEVSFLGQQVTPDVATGVAYGIRHPMTKDMFLSRSISRRHTSDNLSNTSGASLAKTTITHADDLKRGIPIQRYFKSRRMPLAELDPNSFTPSPSQRRLLDDHSDTSWVAQSVPSRPSAAGPTRLLRTPTTPILSGTSWTASDGSGRLSMSTLRPPKRPRLCADETVGTDAVSVKRSDCVTSRFFATSETPSSQRDKKRGRKTAINIFSDDSVEEAMSRLPDGFDFPQPGPSLEGFTDGSDGAAQALTAKTSTEVECKTHTEAILMSRAQAQPESLIGAAVPRDGVLTSPTSKNSHPHSFEKSAPRSKIPRPLPQALTSTTRDEQLRHASKVSAGGSPGYPGGLGSGPLGKKSTNTLPGKRNTASQARSTPLQRIGCTALSRSDIGGLENAKATSIEHHRILEVSARDSRVAITENCRGFKELPTISSTAGSTRLRGSEDLMVPDSEEEEDCGLSGMDSDVEGASMLRQVLSR